MSAETKERAAQLEAEDAGPGYSTNTRPEVAIEKGKLVLPTPPTTPDDKDGCCRWLSAVFNLDKDHPITSGRHEGLRGPDGHVVLHRAGDAPPIRFEPASKINNPTQLIPTLSWRLIPTDGAVHALKADHCRDIAHVIRMLCGAHEAMSEADEADAIVGDHLQRGQAVDGRTTYGTGAQSYEAAISLRREADPASGRWYGPPRYLIDAESGELVIGVSDLTETARRHIGSSLPRGWLDARMQTLGWTRIRLDGHALPGRAGRKGAHARIDAYRGHRPDQAVTT